MDIDVLRALRLPSSLLEAEQIDCLASSLRRKLLLLLSRSGPCTAAELATFAETYPESLYHHLNRLVEVGLVHQVGSVRKGARDVLLFDTVATNWNPRPQPWDPEYAERFLRLVQSYFKFAADLQPDAIRTYAVHPDPGIYVGGRLVGCNLSEKRVGELKQKLQELTAWLESPEEGAETRHHCLFMAIAPAPESSR